MDGFWDLVVVEVRGIGKVCTLECLLYLKCMRILPALILINFGLFLLMSPSVFRALFFVLMVGYLVYKYQRRKGQKINARTIERYDIPLLIIGLISGVVAGLASFFAPLFIALCVLLLIVNFGGGWKGLTMITKDHRLECPYKGAGKGEDICLNFEISPRHIHTVTNMHTWGISAVISYYSIIFSLSAFIGFFASSYL